MSELHSFLYYKAKNVMLSILEPIELHVTKRGPQWKVRLYFVVKKTPDSLPNVEKKKKKRAISATLLRIIIVQNATSFSLYRHVETQLWILLDQTGCRKWWNNAVSLNVWKIMSRLNFRRTNVTMVTNKKLTVFCSLENAILSPQMFKL